MILWESILPPLGKVAPNQGTQGTYGSPNPSLIPDILMREGFGEP